MLAKKELMVIGFFVGLVVIVAIFAIVTKKINIFEKSVDNPVSNYDFFSSAAKNVAKDIYVSAFDAEGNIYPLNLDDFIYKEIRKTQNALMDQVNAVIAAGNFVKKNTPVFMQVDGVGRLQTDGSRNMKATAGGNGQPITLF
jgi:hypothetical protein